MKAAGAADARKLDNFGAASAGMLSGWSCASLLGPSLRGDAILCRGEHPKVRRRSFASERPAVRLFGQEITGHIRTGKPTVNLAAAIRVA